MLFIIDLIKLINNYNIFHFISSGLIHFLVKTFVLTLKKKLIMKKMLKKLLLLIILTI